MEKKKVIANICRTAGIATQIGAIVAIGKYKKLRLGTALNAACEMVYWAPAVADKQDPTIRHEVGIVCSTIAAMSLLRLLSPKKEASS